MFTTITKEIMKRADAAQINKDTSTRLNLGNFPNNESDDAKGFECC